ncbi:thiamine transporter [Atopostipes suicloacalis DSM 15692]|uniref:Thiamine transporter n=1 Tax=Atopostipes suicloacalis DSM 15692 TaxID=1121025 RepID=A0A1M4SJD7_9LACT|nr:energy-coupled thiamine transporter ThiT [Atopostipes suicloacalis]SHE32262.1 thiamine transporter [Atopostipes suicloacalis DSM 15692]
MTKRENLVVSIEAAIFAVMAFTIAFMPLDVGPFEIELGMVPIIVFSYRRGWKAGISSGFLWGLIKLTSGNITVLSVLQVFIEYVFAFAVSGLAGVAWKKLKEDVSLEKWSHAFITVAWSVFLAAFVKYGIHFIAGVIYWHLYAPEGMSPFIYSLIVNGSSGIASFIVVTLITSLLIYRAPVLIFPKE